MRARSSATWSSKRQGRLLVGIGGLVLSLGYALEAVRTLPMGDSERPGAGVFPLLVAALMALSSLGVVLELARRKGESGDERLELPQGADLRRLLGVGASIAVYAFLAPVLGHLSASTIMSVAVVRLLRPAPWRSTIITGVAIAVGTYLLFVIGLAVPLPTGILG